MAAEAPRGTLRPSGATGAVAGLAAGGLALGLTELFAGVVPGVPSLLGAVGDTVIDWLPPSVVHFGVTVFGSADKAVLIIIMVAVCARVAVALGRVATHAPRRARVGFVVFAVVGVAAALRDPQAEPPAVVAATAVALAAGIAALVGLLRLAPPTSRVRSSPRAVPIVATDRRAFLAALGTVATGAALSAVAGRRFALAAAAASRSGYSLPAPARPVSPPLPAAALEVGG